MRRTSLNVNTWVLASRTQQIHFLDVDWIYGSLRCFFCFFALPLLLVVLWLVSNKVEKVQKESTIGLFKVQHVLYIELDLPNWYSHSTKEGDPESHSCSSIVEPI